MLKKFPKLERIHSFFASHGVLSCFLISLLTNLAIEMLSRHSFFEGIKHIFISPQVFFYNSLAIFTITLIALFFRKRAFAVAVILAPFLSLGIINCAVLAYRVTPVSATDFVKIKSIFGIFNLYLEGWVLVAIGVFVVAIILLYLLIYKKSVLRERRVVHGIVLLPTFIVLLALISNTFISQGYLSKKFTNLNDAYEDYGFVYCFSCSVFDTGIDKPENYSEEKVNTILDKIKAETTNQPELKPNVIFLQLESFFDVNEINSLEYSENPIPCFTYLKENYPHGALRVPYIGSGTANVEFEIMTGMSLDYFGPGEYPYKTVLQTTACESIAFNLKELGYTAHAVHNHKGSFYDRAHVFSSLGYDTFTCLEFMQNATYNPIGWANDSVLTKEILNCLDSTDNQDFVYGITVQSHGVYSPEVLESVDYIYDVRIVDETTRVNEVAFEYYLTQLSDVDSFVSELLGELDTRDEETVVVIYGDHLPYFALRDDEMKDGNVYETEYVIWSNYPLEAEGKDLYSYELSAHVLSQLGMNNGLITKLHQNSQRDDEYFASLETLQYDMLYGDKECYIYDTIYTPSELKMGVIDFEITDVKNTEEGLRVSGLGFTEFTWLKVNGEKHQPVYVDDSTLLLPEFEILYGDVINAIQTNGKRTTFTTSEPFVFGEASEYKNVPEDVRS